LVIGFKRASNIIAGYSEFAEVNEIYLKEDSEITLHHETKKLSNVIKKLLITKDYEKILDELVLFGTYIDNFFDDVLVNTDDEMIKRNRYNLLKEIRELFLTVADLNMIVSEK
jgi:glycyl-tRNA synthetase beta chain